MATKSEWSYDLIKEILNTAYDKNIIYTYHNWMEEYI